jgi:hypothetical protein
MGGVVFGNIEFGVEEEERMGDRGRRRRHPGGFI